MSGISPECSVAIQNDIYILTLDDYSPHGILGGLTADHNFVAWQYTIDIIYRCLVAGFWRVWNVEWMELHGIKNYEFFCKKLSELNPFDLSLEGEEYWLEPILCCTDFSLNLVKRFGISAISSDFCAPFMDEVANAFAANGVAWDVGSIFPVKA